MAVHHSMYGHPERLRLQYQIAVFQQRQNLVELAIIHHVSKKKKEELGQLGIGIRPWIGIGNDNLACMVSYSTDPLSTMH